MENKKSNTNVKTTMDFFKQKRAKANSKKLFSHIEINSDINNNKPSFATSADFNSTNQSIYKSDIFQIDTYLDKVKQILLYFSETREKSEQVMLRTLVLTSEISISFCTPSQPALSFTSVRFNLAFHKCRPFTHRGIKV